MVVCRVLGEGNLELLFNKYRISVWEYGKEFWRWTVVIVMGMYLSATKL